MGRGGRASAARRVAAETLLACQRQGAWSDGHLKKAIRRAGLDRRDAALATQLAFGVLQRRMTLDFCLRAFSSRPLEKLDPPVLTALRLGAYQILFLDKIPPSAAVDQSVALARELGRSPAAGGYVNGLLRALLRAEQLPAPPAEDPVEALSISSSHPRWLVEAMGERLGLEGAEAIFHCHNGAVPAAAQVNTLRCTPEELGAALAEEGVESAPHPWLPGCLTLGATGDLEALSAYRSGLFYIQDPAARLAVLAADPRPGMAVLDACAAPGGKTFAAAIQMAGEGKITACDIHPHKEALIRAGARRLGLEEMVETAVQDGKARREAWEGRFDLVLADVPCSGLGIIRKKPDIRYKDPAPLAGLPGVQRAILDNVSAYVRPGGALLYATCTLLRRENEEVAEGFLRDHPEFALEPFALPGPAGESEGMLTLWPHIHGTDGFFIAKLRRRP